MREALRKRYWCDHCKKGGGSRFHMAAHEEGCTLNPQRKCRMCKSMEVESKPLVELIAFVASKAEWESAKRDKGDRGFLPDEAVKQLRELAGNCPVCMLAALRQAQAIASNQVFDMKAEIKSLYASGEARRSEDREGEYA